VLGSLQALVVVKQCDDLSHHRLGRIVIADVLCDGDELHPILRELTNVEFERKAISHEPGERVHVDGVDGVASITGTGLVLLRR
jgi:hypothetical protein